MSKDVKEEYSKDCVSSKCEISSDYEAQSCGCGNNRGCPVRVFGTVELAQGSEVGISYGSFVNLVPGTTVSITPGTSVNLNPNSTISLTPGTSVGINGSVSVNNNFTTTDAFNQLATPLTPYTISADGTYYTSVFDVSNYKDYTWYISNLATSGGTVTVTPQYAPTNQADVIWTSDYLAKRETTALTQTATVTPASAVVIEGNEGIRYTRLAITVSGLTTGQTVTLRGSLQGSQY